MSPRRIAVLVPIFAVAACGGSGSGNSTPAVTTLPPVETSAPASPTPATPDTPGTGASTAAAPTSAAPASSSPATTAPHVPVPSTSAAPDTGAPAVGSTITGTGAGLTRPLAPTTKNLTTDCSALQDTGFTLGTCVTSAAPGGSIVALVETSTPSRETRALVYRKVSGRFSLALRASVTSPGTTVNVYESDLNADGDAKAIFTTPSSNADYLQGLDVVDTTGLVVMHLNLNGGFARAARGGGLEAWFPAPAGGYTHDVIGFRSGRWVVTSQDHQSDTQAQPNNGGGFTN